MDSPWPPLLTMIYTDEEEKERTSVSSERGLEEQEQEDIANFSLFSVDCLVREN